MKKANYRQIFVYIFVLQLLVISSLNAQDNPSDSTVIPGNIGNKTEAYRAALRFTGFDKARGFDSARTFDNIVKSVLRDNSIPNYSSK